MRERWLVLLTLLAGCAGPNQSADTDLPTYDVDPAQEMTGHVAREQKTLRAQPTALAPVAEVTQSHPTVAEETPAPDLQSRRLAMIKRLMADGIFARVDVPGTLPHLVVGDKFYGLDIADKAKLVEVVYAYYYDTPEADTHGSVVLKNRYTGARIGTFNRFGLNLK